MANAYGPPAPGQYGPPLPGPARGAMDPVSYDPRYDQKSAGLLAQQAQTELTQAPERSTFMDYAGDILPALAMGAMTGGAAIPAVLAYGIGAGSKRFNQDAQVQEDWSRGRHGAAGQIYGAASDRLNKGFDPYQARAQTAASRDPNMQREYEWAMSLPEGPQREQALKAWQNKYSGREDELNRLIQERPELADTIGGYRGDVGYQQKAGEETGKQQVQETFQRREFVETGMDVIDDLDMALERTNEVLGLIENGEIGQNLPLIGTVTQMFSENDAFLASEAVAQALQNLQIVNLAPVTEKEFAEIKKMFADVASGKPANIGRLKSSVDRITRAIEVAKRKMDRRGRRGLGPDFEYQPYFPPTPAGAPAPAEAFDAQAELDKLLGN